MAAADEFSQIQSEAQIAEGMRGRSRSKAHYSPHHMPSADLAASQLSILLLPFNPPPPAGEGVTRRQP